MASPASPFLELAHVLVRLNHVGSFIVKANHSIMSTAKKLAVADFRGSTLEESQIETATCVRSVVSPVRRRM